MFKGVFDDVWFGHSVLGNINNMLLTSSFKGSTSLTYVRFSSGVGNLVNSSVKHSIGFIFGNAKYMFDGFIGFEQGFDILFSQEFRDMIDGSLDMITIWGFCRVWTRFCFLLFFAYYLCFFFPFFLYDFHFYLLVLCFSHLAIWFQHYFFQLHFMFN